MSQTSEMIELLERQCQLASDKNSLRTVEKLTAEIINLKADRRLLHRNIEKREESHKEMIGGLQSEIERRIQGSQSVLLNGFNEFDSMALTFGGHKNDNLLWPRS